MLQERGKKKFNLAVVGVLQFSFNVPSIAKKKMGMFLSSCLRYLYIILYIFLIFSYNKSYMQYPPRKFWICKDTLQDLCRLLMMGHKV